MATQEVNQQPVIEDHQPNNVLPATPAEEFSLAIKPRGIPFFKLSALYKSRLKCCIFLNLLCILVLSAKLSDELFDFLEIFILELQELFIPKPLAWEYIHFLSIFSSLIGLRSLSNNRISSLNYYIIGTIVLAILPLLGAAIYFYRDIYEFSTKKEDADVQFWQGYPVAVWVYGYIIVSLQTHICSIFFAVKLIKLLRSKMKRF